MTLTYEEFKKLVPQETIDFISQALPIMDKYKNAEGKVRFPECRKVRTEDGIVFLTLLYTIYHFNPTYTSFLSMQNYEVNVAEINSNTSYLSSSPSLFEQFSKYFCIYDNYEQYQVLTPIKIIINISEKMIEKCNENSNSPTVFGNYNNFQNFYKEAKLFYEIELNKKINLISKQLFKDLPITTINFLETASKIYRLLINTKNQANVSGDKFITKEEDAVILSCFLALFFYKDIKNSNQINSEKEIILYFLEKNGITQNKIDNIPNVKLANSNIQSSPVNYLLLNYYYKKLIYEGRNKNKTANTIFVSDIIGNLFERNLTESFSLEKLLISKNCSPSSFFEFDKIIKEEIEKQKLKIEKEKLDDFYKDLPKATKEFIQFVGKTYLLIEKKIKEENSTTALLSTKNDMKVLSLFIASYFFNNPVQTFFCDHKITLERILSLLNFDVKKEEIEAIELNENILLSEFKSFVYEGINKEKSSKIITINDIVYNLCDYDFHNSSILENIVYELDKDVILEKNFFNQLKNHLTMKEKKRQKELTQKILYDLPIETIKFLEQVTITHQDLVYQKTLWLKKDLQIFSLLLSIFQTNNKEIILFFESLGISEKNVSKFINYCPMKQDYEQNIDILNRYYKEFIFGGNNSNKKRTDLNMESIVSNIFNRKLNNSMDIVRFLGEFQLSYENFDDFDQFFQSYLHNEEKEKQKLEIDKKLHFCYDLTKKYLYNVTKIHQRIIEAVEKGKYNPENLPSIQDIEKVSMILGLFFIQNNSVSFLIKNGLTLDNILNYCNFDKDLLVNLEETGQNDNLLLTNYIKYVDSSKASTIQTIIKSIFDFSINDSLIIKNMINYYNMNYDIFKLEIETEKDYVPELSISERIVLLSQEQVPELHYEDLSSVLKFGSSLSSHSQYIHSQLPKLQLSEVHDHAIESIDQIIQKMYVKNKTVPKKKNIWERLFSTIIDTETKEKSFIFDPSVITELEKEVSNNIEMLIQELEQYDSIQKYIEIYIKKNNAYILKIGKAILEISEGIKTINIDDEMEYASTLSMKTKLKIMEDKMQRFKTSNQLMKQELFKIHQIIINHFITVNALETAKDDLLPLILTEITIGNGRHTENQSLELSSDIVHLFQDLLKRNTVGTMENMEKLKQSTIDQQSLLKIQQDIELYLNELQKVQSSEDDIETSKMIQLKIVH